MNRLFRLLAVVVCLVASWACAQRIDGYNYDEASVPPYTLLDPLTLNDGKPVTMPVEWWQKRRPQILRLFEENIYGRTPADAHVPLRAHVVEQEAHALGGLARRRQVDLYFTPNDTDGPHMRLLVYLPAQVHGRVPVILGLNFGGNQTVLDDPAIQPTPVWTKPKGSVMLLHELPPDSTRGTQIAEWQVRTVLARGYGFATAYYGDLEPDFKNASQYSIRALFQPGTQSKPDQPAATDAWGAIGAWAWGLSRALDYLQNNPQVDAHRVAVTGHSRLGKAADWAAAQDLRFAAVLSTESGKGGQSIQRRVLGETVQHLEHSFPNWFCANYVQWAGHDTDIPADGNLLLSLIAPRPLYVASAQGDEWSDPRGEFLSLRSASRVYALLGHPGLPPDASMPSPDQPVMDGRVAYHERTGKHDVTSYDWEQYLDFLDAQFNAEPAGMSTHPQRKQAR